MHRALDIKKHFNLKEHFRKIIAPRVSPHSIGLGFAIGTLIAMLPTFGFGPLIALLLVVPFFPNINKISLFGAFLLWNPFVMIPIYIINYRVGDFLLHTPGDAAIEISFYNIFELLSLKFIIGNVITSLAFSILGYFVIYFFAWEFQQRKKRKSRKKMLRENAEFTDVPEDESIEYEADEDQSVHKYDHTKKS